MTASADEKFPALHGALLGSSQLSALFRDYRDCATVDEILIKPGPGYAPTDCQPTLDYAEQLLQARSVRGVQIRYRYDHIAWCDTLMPLAEGIRLVRMQQ